MASPIDGFAENNKPIRSDKLKIKDTEFDIGDFVKFKSGTELSYIIANIERINILVNGSLNQTFNYYVLGDWRESNELTKVSVNYVDPEGK